MSAAHHTDMTTSQTTTADITLVADLDEFLAAHSGVNSTAGWAGSPNPADPKNIRRVCKCGDVIAWPEQRAPQRPGQWFPLSGYAFDSVHRAHVAEALAAHLAAKNDS